MPNKATKRSPFADLEKQFTASAERHNKQYSAQYFLGEIDAEAATILGITPSPEFHTDRKWHMPEIKSHARMVRSLAAQALQAIEDGNADRAAGLSAHAGVHLQCLRTLTPGRKPDGGYNFRGISCRPTEKQSRILDKLQSFETVRWDQLYDNDDSAKNAASRLTRRMTETNTANPFCIIKRQEFFILEYR